MLHNVFDLLHSFIHLRNGSELLPSDGPDRSGRCSVTSDSSGNNLSKNTKRRSFLVVMPDLIGDDLNDGHPWVLGSTGVDSISLVSEPCFNGRVV
jgi:hypothetical protein